MASPTRLRSQRFAGLLLAPVLVACGGPDPAASEPAESEPAESETASAEPEPGGRGGSFGVASAEWPDDIERAEALFARMPKRLAGAELRAPRMFGPAAGVVYGRGDQAPTAWAMRADRGLPDGPAALSMMFGMTMSCEEDSYVGTAAQSQYGGGPDLDHAGSYDPAAGSWWFACTIDGAEGAPDFTGHALGWASGELGWLVTTPDPKTTEAVAEALLAAR